MISIFDMFSIGVGPSSSHTVGPMRAACAFAKSVEQILDKISRVQITLYGSLAFTGIGHATHKAILMGLEGELPVSIDPDIINPRTEAIINEQSLNFLHKKIIHFNYNQDLIFNYTEQLDYHSNGMRFQVFNQNDEEMNNAIYFSIGGGFIINEKEINQLPEVAGNSVPFPFTSAAELLAYCEQEQCSIPDIIMANEKTWRSEKDVNKDVLAIATIMEDCINKGCRTEGILPGSIGVRRRAPPLYQRCLKRGEPGPNHPDMMSWLNAFALAVNEENAAGGRVVTAPTNGGAGVIPAVLNYYKYFCENATQAGVIRFLLTAGAIGILYKKNASISAAEMGCQGEVGVACSMAAGGLAAALEGSIYQIENAAEIGMEHNLGLTCDPVAGLVQIPCIERNAIGAVKAVNAAILALAESGQHKVSLDMVINTMREIGHNMNSIYKETSKGGLAVNVPEC